jgi:hypothetical protein
MYSSITRISPINGPSLVPCPHAGERGQGRAVPSYLSHSYSPWTGKEEERPGRYVKVRQKISFFFHSNRETGPVISTKRVNKQRRRRIHSLL